MTPKQEFYGKLLPELLTPQEFTFTLTLNICYPVAGLMALSADMRFAYDAEAEQAALDKAKGFLDELENFPIFLRANRQIIEIAIEEEYPELDVRLSLESNPS